MVYKNLQILFDLEQAGLALLRLKVLQGGAAQ